MLLWIWGLLLGYEILCMSIVIRCKKIMETKLCIFWKNVDVTSKSLELLNLLNDYWFQGLECYKQQPSVESREWRTTRDQTPTMNHRRIHRKDWCRSGVDGETPVLAPPTTTATSWDGRERDDVDEEWRERRSHAAVLWRKGFSSF